MSNHVADAILGGNENKNEHRSIEVINFGSKNLEFILPLKVFLGDFNKLNATVAF